MAVNTAVHLRRDAMARLTRAQKIERENQAQALSFFREALAALPDARRRQGLRYPLQTVVVTALMAMVCGCDDAEAMQSWGEANADWLESILDMPHGTPTQDVYLAVFAALDPEAFSAVFRAWAELLSLRLQAGGKHIAIDGKTSRIIKSDPDRKLGVANTRKRAGWDIDATSSSCSPTPEHAPQNAQRAQAAGHRR